MRHSEHFLEFSRRVFCASGSASVRRRPDTAWAVNSAPLSGRPKGGFAVQLPRNCWVTGTIWPKLSPSPNLSNRPSQSSLPDPPSTQNRHRNGCPSLWAVVRGAGCVIRGVLFTGIIRVKPSPTPTFLDPRGQSGSDLNVTVLGPNQGFTIRDPTYKPRNEGV